MVWCATGNGRISSLRFVWLRFWGSKNPAGIFYDEDRFFHHFSYHALVKHREILVYLPSWAIVEVLEVELLMLASGWFNFCSGCFGPLEILQDLLVTRINLFIIFHVMLLLNIGKCLNICRLERLLKRLKWSCRSSASIGSILVTAVLDL